MIDWIPLDEAARFNSLEQSNRILHDEICEMFARQGLRVVKERPVREPTPFERQLELVASGRATICAAINYRRPDPEGTVGGVTAW